MAFFGVISRKGRIRNLDSRIGKSQRFSFDFDRNGSQAVRWEEAKPYESIPGPKPLPIPKFGNFWRFTRFGPYWNLDPEKFFIRLKEEFGDVIRMTGIGKRDMVFVSDVKSSEMMYRHELKMPVREAMDCFTFYMDNLRPDIYSEFKAFLLQQGEEWYSTRLILNQIFMSPNSQKPYLKRMETVADEFVERMKKLRDEKMELPDYFDDELGKWALESLGSFILDMRLGFLSDEKSEEALRMINAIRTVFHTSFYLDIMPSVWKYVSTPTWRKFVKSMDTVIDTTCDWTTRKWEELEAEKDRTSEPRSILEALVRKKNADFGNMFAIELIVAGVDTVSTATATALSHLATHPEKQAKLFEELKIFLPEKDTPLTNEALTEMKYLKASVRESFRLRPVAAGNLRTALKDLVIGGYQVPKGTHLANLGLLTSVDGRYFEKSDQYIPERWLKSSEKSDMNVNNSNALASMPFGFGVRSCLGRRFASQEMHVFIAKIIRNFEISYHYGDMEWNMGMFIKPNKPLKFKIADR